MSTKKRKQLGSAMEEFVFGTNEAASLPAPEAAPPPPEPSPEAAPPPPEASQGTEIPPTPVTPETALPTAKPQQPEAPAPEPVRIQSKKPSLMSKLQALDKEATVRFTADTAYSMYI